MLLLVNGKGWELEYEHLLNADTATHTIQLQLQSWDLGTRPAIEVCISLIPRMHSML